MAVSPEGSGDITNSVTWEFSKSVPRRASIIGWMRLYMMNDQGVASCLNADTGEIVAATCRHW